MNNTFFNPTDEFIDKLIPIINNRFVIEIGCGNGTLLRKLIDRNIKAIGIDPYTNIRTIKDKELSTKILSFTIDESFNLINQIKDEKLFIVARPCHSGFPHEYLSKYCLHSEMLYIGFAKNLEIDFERELSTIRFIEFPTQSDFDCVAILKYAQFDEKIKAIKQWQKVDTRVKRLKGDVKLVQTTNKK